LRLEYERLMTLNAESDTVEVHPVLRPGTEPEQYQIVFKCKGISGIDSSQRPQYGVRHSVRVTCGETFPSRPPDLYWESAIWHPNIHHERKSVCVNASEWLGGMLIYDLCRQMLEMVQYKNYHAESIPPRPLDPVVAQWV